MDSNIAKNKKIIGLVGQTGAGKDEICEWIKKQHPDALFLRFSSPLSEALNIFCAEIKKEDQQWLGQMLRTRFGDDVLAKALEKKIVNAENSVVVLNGIRYQVEADLVKKLGGELAFVFADSKVRWERVSQRHEKADDQGSYDNFLKLDQAPTEANILQIAQLADYKIDNGGSLENLHEQINKIFHA